MNNIFFFLSIGIKLILKKPMRNIQIKESDEQKGNEINKRDKILI